MTLMIKRLLFLICVLLIASTSQAQSTGLQPYGSYEKGFDSVNLASPAPHIDIPLYTHQGRGDGLATGIHYVYNDGYESGYDSFNDVGWRLTPTIGNEGSVNKTTQATTRCNPGSTTNFWTKTNYSWTFTDNTGYTHIYPGYSWDNSCTNGVDAPTSLSEYPTDGAGYLLNATGANATVTDPAGRVSIYGDLYVADSNGNKNATTAFKGSLPYPSTQQTVTDNTNNSITVTGGTYVTNTAGAVTSRSPFVLSYTDGTGTQRSVTVNYKLYQVHRASIWGSSETLAVGLVDTIDLPDGSSYAMVYESSPTVSGAVTGRLASITFPTGGTISYVYGDDPPLGCGIQSSLSRTTPDGTTTYTTAVTSTYTSNNCAVNSTTTVIHADSSKEIISFITPNVIAGQPNVGMPVETDHQWFDASGHLLRSTMRCYNGATGNCTTQSFVLPISEISTVTTLDNGQQSQRVSFINASGLETELDEYDYGATNPTRKTVTQYASLGNNIIDKPSSVIVYDSTGAIAQKTTYGYDETTPTPAAGGASLPGLNSVSGSRGNRTTKHEWIDGTNSLATTYTYDTAGQVLSETDPKGYTTGYTFDAATDAYLIKRTLPATNSIAHVEQYSIDPATGLILSQTDQNNIVTSFTYADPFMRLTKAKAAYGTPLERWTTYVYDSPNQTRTLADQVTAGDAILATKQVTDSLGRKSVTINQAGAEVDFKYDNMGRLYTQSNPYYPASTSSTSLTTFKYDALGRQISQAYADGSSKTWSYSGPSVTFTDEASHAWIRKSDALGRLVSVQEPGTLLTTYAYSATDHMTGATQSGTAGDTTRTRAFTYDLLSRLITSSNPEAGLICYGSWSGGSVGAGTCQNGYDGNSNLSYKTDARGVVVSYTYDSLNRILSQTYSDGTVGHSYNYDNTTEGSSGIGRPFGTFVGSSAGQGYYYDALGRIDGTSFQTPSLNGAWQAGVSIKYDLAGDMTDLTYPDGRHIKQGFDGASQLSSSNLVDISGVAQSQIYLQSMLYNPDGTTNVMTLGNGLQQTVAENNRLQVQSMTSSSLLAPFNGQNFVANTYCYSSCTTGGTANNGNIWGITDNLKAANTQGFTYDSLNRVSSFSLGGAVNQQYSIDSFGNMSGIVGGAATTTFAPATNRISNLACASSTTPYDAAGNQLCDSDQYGSVRQYTYDAESRISQITSLNAGTPFETYVYYADGSRARKTNANGNFTEYVRFGGVTLAEKDQAGVWTDYIYANGKQIARVRSSDTRLHLSGVSPSSGTGNQASGSFKFSHTVQAGDMLVLREYNGNGRPYFNLYFSDGTTLPTSGAGCGVDQNGVCLSQEPTQNTWVNRIVNLGAIASGKLLNYIILKNGPTAPAGQFDVMIADVAIIGADGTVSQLLGDNPTLGCTAAYTTGMTSVQCVSETVTATNDVAGAPQTVRYFLSDHLGTAQLELTAGGWPIWKGQFAPFGQEIDTLATSNNYKFTGKERDTESGLDNFGARYMSSNMGRFMSPDWSDRPEAVPYSSLDDPQSLNLYGYVKNNPLRSVDLDGHRESENRWGWSDGIWGGGDDRWGGSKAQAEGFGMSLYYSALAQQQSSFGATVNDRRLISVSGTNPLALTPLVEHYLVGSATSYTLSDEAFSKFVSAMQESGRLNGELSPVPGMPDGVSQQQVSTYGTSYALAVGSTTLYYMGGRPVGYRDYWDFDSKPWGARPLPAELETRGAGGAMDALGGKPFWVEYGIHPQ